jgi:hypothetical protein
MAMPVKSAISTPVVMTCTAVCTAERPHVVDGEPGVLAAEADEPIVLPVSDRSGSCK